jgi:hypothetical protein
MVTANVLPSSRYAWVLDSRPVKSYKCISGHTSRLPASITKSAQDNLPSVMCLEFFRFNISSMNWLLVGSQHNHADMYSLFLQTWKWHRQCDSQVVFSINKSPTESENDGYHLLGYDADSAEEIDRHFGGTSASVLKVKVKDKKESIRQSKSLLLPHYTASYPRK